MRTSRSGSRSAPSSSTNFRTQAKRAVGATCVVLRDSSYSQLNPPRRAASLLDLVRWPCSGRVARWQNCAAVNSDERPNLLRTLGPFRRTFSPRRRDTKQKRKVCLRSRLSTTDASTIHESRAHTLPGSSGYRSRSRRDDNVPRAELPCHIISWSWRQSAAASYTRRQGLVGTLVAAVPPSQGARSVPELQTHDAARMLATRRRT